MNYIKRSLDLKNILEHKSCFLFGPRQTGKSMLIRETFKTSKVYNLLNRKTFRQLNHSPELIRQELSSKDQIIVIDEIQKIPDLLNEVHLLIEEFNIRFLLTGSSARALKKKGINMLGGRARSRMMHPFIYTELKQKFDLVKSCRFGLLPSIYFSDSPWEDLAAYVDDYLKEEIAAESIVRNVGAFSRFLEVSGQCHSQLINYTKIGNDAQVHPNTVREYFQILIDTLLAFELPAFKQTIKRKPIATSKFYFFDSGVARFLQKRQTLQKGSPEFGEAFEAYIFHELKAYCSYAQGESLSYWRSKSQFEVDFILNEKTAIEVKAKNRIANYDLKGIRALQEEKLIKNHLIVSLESVERNIDGIRILPWTLFLEELWNNDFT